MARLRPAMGVCAAGGGSTRSTGNPSLHLVELSRNRRDVRRFVRFAYEIYREDAFWVAPLEVDFLKVFQDANPLFQHAEMALWIAVRNGRDVGRIAAIVDHHHNRYQNDHAAFFGFFECVDDPTVSRALLDQVSSWARARGLVRVLGPMNPTTNDECGLLVEGFDSRPVLMMTYNPRFYVNLVEGAGFHKAKDLIAFHIDLSNAPMDRLGRIAAKVRQRHPEMSFRAMTWKSLRADLEKIKAVYNSAWSENWGFVPMTDPEMDFLAARLKPLFQEGFVQLAEDRSGPVGFLLAMPDYNVAFQALRGRLLTPRFFRFLPYLLRCRRPTLARVLTFGVKESHRGRGLESVMLWEGLSVGARLGYREAEASWILEDNVPMRRILEVFGARPYKTYRLYDRPL